MIDIIPGWAFLKKERTIEGGNPFEYVVFSATKDIRSPFGDESLKAIATIGQRNGIGRLFNNSLRSSHFAPLKFTVEGKNAEAQIQLLHQLVEGLNNGTIAADDSIPAKVSSAKGWVSILTIVTGEEPPEPAPVMTEQKEQEMLIRWCDSHPDPRLSRIYSHLNGLKVTIGTLLKAKRSGARKGLPDLFLPIPSAPYHGLYIEMKRIKGGRITPEQEDWLRDLNDSGYKAIASKGHEEAIEVIIDYLKLPTN